MNIIKISEEVFETILNNDTAIVDKDNFPFNTFCVAFPYNFMKSPEEMVEDALKEFKKAVNSQGLSYRRMLEEKKEDIDKQRQIIYNYCNSDLYVIYNVQVDEITVKHSNPQTIKLKEQILFNGKIIRPDFLPLPLPIVSINEMNSDEMWMFHTLRKLVLGVVYAMNNRDIEIIESPKQTKTQGINHEHTGKRTENVKYITSIKRYNVNRQKDSGTKRVFTMQAWDVRGHWRHLKNGNKIWVNSYIKGDKEKINEQDNFYKLNKIRTNEENPSEAVK